VRGGENSGSEGLEAQGLKPDQLVLQLTLLRQEELGAGICFPLLDGKKPLDFQPSRLGFRRTPLRSDQLLVPESPSALFGRFGTALGTCVGVGDLGSSGNTGTLSDGLGLSLGMRASLRDFGRCLSALASHHLVVQVVGACLKRLRVPALTLTRSVEVGSVCEALASDYLLRLMF
jgi:hypothetical protein